MTPTEQKTALRNLINATIKGDPNDEAQKLVHDVLQAKMQARIAKATAPDDEQPNGDE